MPWNSKDGTVIFYDASTSEFLAHFLLKIKSGQLNRLILELKLPILTKGALHLIVESLEC